MDFKGWFRTGNGTRVEPLTVRDWHSRFILGIQLLPNQSDAAVRAALTRRFRRLGLPQVIRVDNGAPFGGHGALGLARLSVWWRRLGMAVEFIRHAHPEDNAGHEQRPRVFKAQTTLPPTRTPQGQQVRSSRWRHYDNRLRPPEALDEFILAHVLERGEPGDFFFRQAHLTGTVTRHRGQREAKTSRTL